MFFRPQQSRYWNYQSHPGNRGATPTFRPVPCGPGSGRLHPKRTTRRHAPLRASERPARYDSWGLSDHPWDGNRFFQIKMIST